MKQYNFGTFTVDDSNRVAFETCRDIANLRPVSPLPVVLLGDRGCGKTHLLYSIVNRVRASSGRTGLAYVTAHDFPEQVRALISDPSPVERAGSAILLVDQLEGFDECVEELDAVIRIFLDNGHYVLLASNVHPGRLHALSEELRGVLAAGHLIDIVPKTAESKAEHVSGEMCREYEERIAGQRSEIERLKEAMEAAQAPHGTGDVEQRIETLQGEKALLEAEVADLGRRLSQTSSEVSHGREELQQLLTRVEALVGQLEANRAQAKKREQEQEREIARLSSLVNQGGHAAKAPSQAELNGVLKQLEALRAEFDAERRNLDHSLSEARERADADVGRAKAEVRRAMQERDQAIEEQRRVLEALDRAKARRDEYRLASERANIEVESLRMDVAQSREADARLRAELEEAAAARRAAEDETEQLRAALNGQAADMEALRREAAAQVAEANAHAGESARRLSEISTEFDAMRAMCRDIETELAGILARQAAEAEAAKELVARLTTHEPHTPPPAPPEEKERMEMPGDDLEQEPEPSLESWDEEDGSPVKAVQEAAGPVQGQAARFVPLDPADYALGDNGRNDEDEVEDEPAPARRGLGFLHEVSSFDDEVDHSI